MAGRITDTDRGYKALRRDLARIAAAPPRVLVGILQDKGSERTEDGGITLAGYAAANEFGTAKIPERSFLRSAVDENRTTYVKGLAKAVDALVTEATRSGVDGAGLIKMERSLGQLGARAARDVKNKIRDLREPPNAAVTLERKYPGNNPLIHTGRMRQAISVMVDMTGRAEGTSSAPKKARRRKAAA